MWCKRCQQDVPAVAKSDDASIIYCARCGTNMRRQEVERRDDCESDNSARPAEALTPCEEFEHWQWDEDLQEAERLIHAALAETANLAESDSHQPKAHAAIAATDSKTQPSGRRSRRQARRKTAGGSLLSTIVVGIGLSGMMCGGALLVWAHVATRSDLWNIGLPVALAGQAVLVLGLLVQLYRVFGIDAAQGGSSDASADRSLPPQQAPLTAYPTAISVHYRHATAGQHASGNDPWIATAEDDFEPLSDAA